MKYHVNPETGRPNQCRAQKACPFGGAEVHFATKPEAQAHYEKAMSGQTFATSKKKPPIVVKQSKYKLSQSFNTNYLDYDYDDYSCSSFDCGSDGDMCRDKVYSGLTVEPISEDDIYNMARDVIGASPNDPLPADLKARLDARMGEWQDTDNWEISGEPDYYGESVVIEPPQEFEAELKDWYYDQDNAVDPAGVLTYLRGAGFATKGYKPVEAVQEFLASENAGIRPARVMAAKSVEMRSVSLKNVVVPNKHHYASSEARPPTPPAGVGQSLPIAGILIETAKVTPQYPWRNDDKLGQVELIDGYHRLKHLNDNTSKRVGTYFVLRK